MRVLTGSIFLIVLGTFVYFKTGNGFYFKAFNGGEDDSLKIKFPDFFDQEATSDENENDFMDDVEVKEREKKAASDLFLPKINKSSLGCAEVREERHRCCRVYDHVVEAWWCPETRPFCCQQGTACAVCCSADEQRALEARQLIDSDRKCHQIPAESPARPAGPTPAVDDETWFWSGMKAAWLTMAAVLLVSVCCTCLAHKCITYLVTVVTEDDDDLEEEYLAHHFGTLTLAADEERLAARRTPSGGLLPPKYSDINFLPAQPEVTPPAAPVPSDPPPEYTSDPEPPAPSAPPPPAPPPPPRSNGL